jgi:hypothetical protein
VPLFRDLAGNHYNIPADELERFKVNGDLPEDARLTGLEAPTAPPRPPPGRPPMAPMPPMPRYVWQEAEHGEGGPQYTVAAPPGTPAALAGQTYLLVPVEPAGGA